MVQPAGHHFHPFCLKHEMPDRRVPTHGVAAHLRRVKHSKQDCPATNAEPSPVGGDVGAQLAAGARQVIHQLRLHVRRPVLLQGGKGHWLGR